MEAIENIGIGILIMIFEIGIIYYMSRRPPSYPLVSLNFKGYAIGATVILLGIIYIMNKLHLW